MEQHAVTGYSVQIMTPVLTGHVRQDRRLTAHQQEISAIAECVMKPLISAWRSQRLMVLHAVTGYSVLKMMPVLTERARQAVCVTVQQQVISVTVVGVMRPLISV
jgi:hypothetical protein